MTLQKEDSLLTSDTSFLQQVHLPLHNLIPRTFSPSFTLEYAISNHSDSLPLNTACLPHEVYHWCRTNDIPDLPEDLSQYIAIKQWISSKGVYPQTFHLDVDGVGYTLWPDRADATRYLFDMILVKQAQIHSYDVVLYPLQLVREYTHCPLHLCMMLAEAMTDFIYTVEIEKASNRKLLYKHYGELLLCEYPLTELERRAISPIIGADLGRNRTLHLNMYLTACENCIRDLSREVCGEELVQATWFLLLIAAE